MVEGKKKAAKNENEYIYHEEVPDLSNLQEVKGASLVKGIEFNINDPEVLILNYLRKQYRIVLIYVGVRT